MLEVEPQTLWRRRTDAHDGLGIDRVVLDQLLNLPQTRIAHGIGMPVGGTVQAPIEDQRLLNQTLREINPVWFSEHLSFNRSAMGATNRFAGFLLAPPQCEEAVAVAADNIKNLRTLVHCPIAFETGVNYLRPVAGEMTDGEFFAAVADDADCGILLDLHNLWANEQNGRQRWRDVIRDLPVDRVWEIHVAGGSLLDGYYLDAHCNVVPDQVLEGLEECIGWWPQLGAVVFEILPSFVTRVGLTKIGQQMERLSKIWSSRRASRIEAQPRSQRVPAICSVGLHRCVSRFEQALVARIREPADDADPGIRIYGRLIDDARAATVSQLFRCTVTLLFLALGMHECDELMKSYLKANDPHPFAEDEALDFCGFLTAKAVKAPFLEDVMRFESAILRAARSGRAVTLEFDCDPELLVSSLLAGRMPPDSCGLAAPVTITVQC